MKRIRIAFATICIVCLAAFLAACGVNTDKLGGYLSAMKSSSESCASMQAEVEVRDGEETVYGYTLKLERSGDVFDVTTTERKLNDSFGLGENTETSKIAASGACLLPVRLTEENLHEYAIKDGKLTATVSDEEAMNAVFGTEKFTMQGSATVECTLVKKKISEICVGYRTAGGREVSVKVTYAY